MVQRGLFDDDETPPLERGEIDVAPKVAALDWSEIDPSIFGTLFERGLDMVRASWGETQGVKVERAPERLRRARGINEERGAGFRPDRMIEVESAHGAERVAHAAAAHVSLDAALDGITPSSA